MYYFIHNGHPGSSSEMPIDASEITKEQFEYAVTHLSLLKIVQDDRGVVFEVDILGYRREIKARISSMFDQLKPDMDTLYYLSICITHNIRPSYKGRLLPCSAAEVLVESYMSMFTSAKVIVSEYLNKVDNACSCEVMDTYYEQASIAYQDLKTRKDDLDSKEIHNDATWRE
jgi:hypothetical protein